MTQEEFIEVLDNKGYSYEIEGDKIVVSYQWTVNLESLKKLPSGVEFNNGGTDFGQTMHIGFAGSVIPPLDGIIEKTVDRVSVVLVIFGRVDPPLRCNAVGASW